MVSGRASERAFFAVSALVFAASAAVTIVWSASMSAMSGMPMPGGWTMSMAWMRMPGQTWLGAAASAEDFTDAITARKAAVNAMASFMARFDLILTPTVPVAAFAIDRAGPGLIDGCAVDDDARTPALYPANLTGQPAASVPAGLTVERLPVGLQVVGRRLDDALVITAAAAFERVRPWTERRPPVSVWST